MERSGRGKCRSSGGLGREENRRRARAGCQEASGDVTPKDPRGHHCCSFPIPPCPELPRQHPVPCGFTTPPCLPSRAGKHLPTSSPRAPRGAQTRSRASVREPDAGQLPATPAPLSLLRRPQWRGGLPETRLPVTSIHGQDRRRPKAAGVPLALTSPQRASVLNILRATTSLVKLGGWVPSINTPQMLASRLYAAPTGLGLNTRSLDKPFW